MVRNSKLGKCSAVFVCTDVCGDTWEVGDYDRSINER